MEQRRQGLEAYIQVCVGLSLLPPALDQRCGPGRGVRGQGVKGTHILNMLFTTPSLNSLNSNGSRGQLCVCRTGGGNTEAGGSHSSRVGACATLSDEDLGGDPPPLPHSAARLQSRLASWAYNSRSHPGPSAQKAARIGSVLSLEILNPFGRASHFHFALYVTQLGLIIGSL